MPENTNHDIEKDWENLHDWWEGYRWNFLFILLLLGSAFLYAYTIDKAEECKRAEMEHSSWGGGKCKAPSAVPYLDPITFWRVEFYKFKATQKGAERDFAQCHYEAKKYGFSPGNVFETTSRQNNLLRQCMKSKGYGFRVARITK